MDHDIAMQADLSAATAKLQGMASGFFYQLPNLVFGIIVMALFYVVARLVHAAIRRGFGLRDRRDLGNILGGSAKWAVIIFGVLIVAAIVFPSIHPANILTALGFGSVAIGFALKDILQNWVSGLLILLNQPFRQGDQIVVNGLEGTVEHITSRATVIRTYDARRIIIPNADVYTNPVTVMTAFEMRRDEYDVGIGYGDDVARTLRVLVDALTGIDAIAKDPAPEAIPWELAGSSVNLKLRWWTKASRADVVSTRGQVILAVRELAAKEGFDLPYPTQVVLWHDQTEETDGDRTRQREGWPAGDNPPNPRPLAAAPARAEPDRPTVIPQKAQSPR